MNKNHKSITLDEADAMHKQMEKVKVVEYCQDSKTYKYFAKIKEFTTQACDTLEEAVSRAFAEWETSK